MKADREHNYDLLKVVSMIAVIMIHVSTAWIVMFSKYIADGGEINTLLHPMMAYVYSTVSRFAVPCFIMLSGSFVLDDSKTAGYHDFYHKKLMKIGIPTFIFSILYILYRIPFCFLGDGSVLTEAVSIIKDIIVGSPFYHMWYMYMLLVLYLLAPIAVIFKDSISYRNFRKIAFIFLVLASISRLTTEKVMLNWDLGQSFEYLGYFMTGYVIRKDLQKNNFKGILLILLGIVVEIATAFVDYKLQIVDGIAENKLNFPIVAPYAPTIVLASLLIFAGFTMLKIEYNKHIKKLSDMSFIIYLIHAGVWDFFVKFMRLIKGKDYLTSLNNLYWIPVFVVMVLIISVLLTVVYNNLELFVIQRKHKKQLIPPA